LLNIPYNGKPRRRSRKGKTESAHVIRRNQKVPRRKGQDLPAGKVKRNRGNPNRHKAVQIVARVENGQSRCPGQVGGLRKKSVAEGTVSRRGKPGDGGAGVHHGPSVAQISYPENILRYVQPRAPNSETREPDVVEAREEGVGNEWDPRCSQGQCLPSELERAGGGAAARE